jgi:hypothetical protein
VQPPHLWQVGLASAKGRTYESVAVRLLLTPRLRELFAIVGDVLDRDFVVTPYKYAHVTLYRTENASIAWRPVNVYPGCADVQEIALTEYSFRLVPDQEPFSAIADAFGLPKPVRPYGITLAYARTTLSVRQVSEVIQKIEAALRDWPAITVAWELVELQKRPGVKPFEYVCLASRGRGPDATANSDDPVQSLTLHGD